MTRWITAEEGDSVQHLRPKLMTICVVLASLIPILWETGVGSDVMKPIAARIVGGMITSTIHVLILVPMFFALMKESALNRGTLDASEALARVQSWLREAQSTCASKTPVSTCSPRLTCRKIR
jgi:hypothetical protein